MSKVIGIRVSNHFYESLKERAGKQRVADFVKENITKIVNLQTQQVTEEANELLALMQRIDAALQSDIRSGIRDTSKGDQVSKQLANILRIVSRHYGFEFCQMDPAEARHLDSRAREIGAHVAETGKLPMPEAQEPGEGKS